MIEQLIEETKDKHSKRAITPEQFQKWRRSNVTVRLKEELEIAVLESFQDYLPHDPNLALCEAKLREGAAQMVERVLDWIPAGLETEDED